MTRDHACHPGTIICLAPSTRNRFAGTHRKARTSRARGSPRLTRYQRERDSVTPGAVPIRTRETVLEVDYGAQLAPWLTLRPNLQYIIRPNDTGKAPAAFVIGPYTQVTF